jgi:uncharacterized protein YndB with AHSA1/START domain
METAETTNITVEATIHAPVQKVWKAWSDPKDITQWCAASDDWHAPYAENDLRKDGKFRTTMAAKDGTVSFDFEGVYTNVVPEKTIAYEMSDGRKVVIHFSKQGNDTKVVETFEAEKENPVAMQRDGWQAILDKFKGHVEKT